MEGIDRYTGSSVDESGIPKFSEKDVKQKVREMRREYTTSLAAAKQPRIFDSKVMSISKFIKNFDDYKDLISLSTDKVFSYFLTYLSEHDKSRVQALNLSSDQKEAWESVKPAIISVLTPKTQKMKARAKLRVAQQGEEESAIDFYERLVTVADKYFDGVNTPDLSEDDRKMERILINRLLRQTFLDGLRDARLSAEVSCLKDLTESQLAETAMEKELALQEAIFKRSHSERRANTEIPLLPIPVAENQDDVDRPGPSTRSFQCYSCREYGHYARECPSNRRPKPPSACRKCGDRHWTNECFSSQRTIQQYQQRMNNNYWGWDDNRNRTYHGEQGSSLVPNAPSYRHYINDGQQPYNPMYPQSLRHQEEPINMIQFGEEENALVGNIFIDQNLN